MSLTKITGLYKRIDKRGDLYLTGGWGLANVCIMKNAFKQSEGQPDYYLCLIPNSESPEVMKQTKGLKPEADL